MLLIEDKRRLRARFVRTRHKTLFLAYDLFAEKINRFFIAFCTGFLKHVAPQNPNFG